MEMLDELAEIFRVCFIITVAIFIILFGGNWLIDKILGE